MLISIPIRLTSIVLKRKGIDKALSYISSHKSFIVKQLVEEAGLSRKVAKAIVRDLLWTEHLERVGRRIFPAEKVQPGAIMLNLRDERTDILFKWNGTRELLLRINETDIRELSSYSKIPYNTLRWIVYRLRDSGILSGLHVNEEHVYKPKSLLELVPRKTHRILLRNLFSTVEKFGIKDAPTILYGDASWGRDVLSLELLTLVKGYWDENEQMRVMEGFTIAAKNMASSFGVSVDVAFAMEEVWLAQKLGFVANENMLLKRAEDGICIHGKLPVKEDYFEMHEKVNPSPPDKLEEWIAKGYVMKVGDKYVYTDKAIERFKETSPTYIDEVLLPIFDRKVRFLAVGRPR